MRLGERRAVGELARGNYTHQVPVPAETELAELVTDVNALGAELADQLAELPDDQDIVAYCRGAYCVLAHEAVRLLTDHGRSAMRLADGMLEWRLADLPVAT